ncbi:MAG: M20/M25/M40 family metallo-hydrolase [Eubacteriales bacterium]
MDEIREIINSVTPCMTVSGYEYRSAEVLRDIFAPRFDEVKCDALGSFICTKRCGAENAPNIMLDAHIDEIGMMVREILDGGFLRVVQLGGIDTRIMAASEVWIYGERKIPGVVVSTPPHLAKPGESAKLTPVADLLIDTGYSKDALSKLVRIGTPVGFKTSLMPLLGSQVTGRGFDDKACVSIILRALDMLRDKNLTWDITAVFSTREEVGETGALTASYTLAPDAAIVLDVNFAIQPDVPKRRAGKMGDGPMISLSAVTDRSLTDAIISFAAENGNKLQQTVEPMSTGTNANVVNTTGAGVPVAVVSLPLKNMHTPSEVISLDDAEETATLIAGFIAGGIDKWIRS